jgi:hypothetical protein
VQHWVADVALNVHYHLPGIGLIPAPVQVFGGEPQLNDQIAR